jgi:heterodisulfide reductase subunit A-like polyferredoxin
MNGTAMQVEKRVMVLGDAPEADRLVRELLSLGYTVHWLTAEDASTELAAEGLDRHPGATLVAVEGEVGDFTVRLRDARSRALEPVHVAALVVATGNERHYPAERYGLALAAPVYTAGQVARQLAAPVTTGPALPHRDERVALLLDWGGETAHELVSETLDLATALRQRWHSEVYCFYRDLKVDTPGLERQTRAMREQGVVFCRYDDLDIHVNGTVSLGYVEGELDATMIVLPEAVRPREDTADLAQRLSIRVGEDGYFQEMNIHRYRSGLSTRRGIYLAGRCHMDLDPVEAEADAVQVAAQIDALLGSGWLQPQEPRALVDAQECIRCLTCVRTCPHAAVEIAEYEDAVAARVFEYACEGCGACIANCPVQAIEWVGRTMPAWMAASNGGAA